MGMRYEVERLRRPRRVPPLVLAYSIVLTAYTAYALLDTFVIPRSYASVSQAEAREAVELAVTDSATSGETEGAATAEHFTSDATTELTEVQYLNTTVYVVDVYADDVTNLMAALANDTYGKNVTATTSAMAEEKGATVAINGDYYGARNAGYVVRNGVLYRDTAAAQDQEDLVIYRDGSFEVICEGDVSAQDLVDAGAWQVFSFGPGLVSDGTITVDEDDEVDRAMASNPRTAIGKVSDGHYVLVVADGRSEESEGLTLLELAEFMAEELGASCAYNLDGGGSSTLYYEGEIANNPASMGRRHGGERSVSDIVYVV